MDLSVEMLKLCRNKNPRIVLADLENLPFLDSKFDGILAYTSLLHIPKSEFPKALENIRRLLRTSGLFYIGMKEGDFEGFIESKNYPGKKRFFSLYRDKDIREHLGKHFNIIHHSWNYAGNDLFLNYLCRIIPNYHY
ncbi:class I SAM-dependent methyltransferase [Candidatus Woesearchaeota archaeon]|nr:class I SAM-dependent methyltransferase [Candidatus Woesearchaeota archaeon]